MSLYKGNNLISGAMPNSANQSLSNLNSAGQDIIDGKAETDLSNVTDTGNIKMAGASMPSNKYVDLTLGASGSTYTAPANGFIYIDKMATGGQYMALANLGTDGKQIKVGVQIANTANNQHVELYVPVKKGDIVRVNYNLGGKTTSFRFNYAEGSK